MSRTTPPLGCSITFRSEATLSTPSATTALARGAVAAQPPKPPKVSRTTTAPASVMRRRLIGSSGSGSGCRGWPRGMSCMDLLRRIGGVLQRQAWGSDSRNHLLAWAKCLDTAALQQQDLVHAREDRLSVAYDRDGGAGALQIVDRVDQRAVSFKIGRASCRERVCQYV